MKFKNKKNNYEKKPDEKNNNNVVTNTVKLGFMMTLTSIFSFIFSFFKSDTKKSIDVSVKNEKQSKPVEKQEKAMDLEPVKTEEKKHEKVEEKKQEKVVEPEKTKEIKKEEKNNEVDKPKLDNTIPLGPNIKKEKPLNVNKTEEEEFEIAKKIVHTNNLETKKIAKTNTRVSKLKIIKQALKYISLSELVFKHKQIKELVNSVSLNNSLRSIRNKKNLDLRAVEYKKIKLNTLNSKINQNSLYQIDRCKLEIMDPVILNEIAHIEQSLKPKKTNSLQYEEKGYSKVYTK